MKADGKTLFKAIILVIVAYFFIIGIKSTFFEESEVNTFKDDLKASRDSIVELDSIYQSKIMYIDSLKSAISYRDSIIAKRDSNIRDIYIHYDEKIYNIQSLDLDSTVSLLSRNLSQNDNR